jgi:uncharacterized membrane protein
VINMIDEYLSQLKQELAGSDRATIQDALSDAEEYLRNALAHSRESQPDVPENDALTPIIQEYGTPDEVAAAYKRVEGHMSPALSTQDKPQKRSLASSFFGVMANPRAWGAILYAIFALATGIIYFTWAVTGISLSLSLLILVVGIPFAGLFMLSVRGLALVEGRIVEALLGVRMPRRPIFTNNNLSLWGRFKSLITDKYTWFTLAYMIMQLPLGIFYFTLFVVLISVSLWLIAQPILQLVFGLPAFNIDVSYYIPGWIMPISVLGGIFLLVLTMHLAKLIGRMHGAIAKAMLVRE